MKKIFTLLCLLALPAFGSLPPEISGKILYLIHNHETEKALSCYLEEAKEPDFFLLQQIGSRLIEEGAKSKDPETVMMTLFGAGIAASPDLLPALRRGVQSSELKHQLTALNFLGKLHDDEADQLIRQALSSPFLLTRLEAAYLLAEKSDEGVVDHLRSLIGKVPKEAKPLFAQIVSKVETPEATHFFRELLADSDERVQVEAIFEAAKAKRDDLLPQIRALATHPDRSQQEAALVALGRLKDESSIPLFRKVANGPNQLAAWYALVRLGEAEFVPKIEQKAREGNFFAISLLGELEEGKKLLVDLIQSQDPDVCLNAIIALVRQKDPRAAPCLREILIHDKRDLGFAQHFSPGKGFVAWKVVPMAAPRVKTHPALSMQTRLLKEKVLLTCLDLPEERFLAIARVIFGTQQSELIPLLVELLSNLRSEEAIALLKENQQKAGAPLIRNYCNLALFRLNEKGPYEENLVQWAREEQNHELIRFKDEKGSESQLHYTLTPEETSQLLIQTFETLASARSEAGITALLHAMAYGNPKNKYALAGLLIRTAE